MILQMLRVNRPRIPDPEFTPFHIDAGKETVGPGYGVRHTQATEHCILYGRRPSFLEELRCRILGRAAFESN